MLRERKSRSLIQMVVRVRFSIITLHLEEQSGGLFAAFLVVFSTVSEASCIAKTADIG